MGKFDGVLLASDYDGTLRPEGAEGAMPGDLEALEYFQNKGGIFIVATGRSFPTFRKQARQFSLRRPALVSNGAVLQDMATGEVLFCHAMPQRAREDVAQLIAAFPALGAECYNGDTIYACRVNEYIRFHMNLVGTTCQECRVEDMPMPWTKTLLESDHETLLQVREMVLDRWSAHYECIFSNWELLELTGKGVHKGSGVAACAEMWGIRRENVYCIGDNENDAPMLEAANILFVPETAVDTLKARNTVVIPGGADGCARQVVEILDRKYSR